jgi:hypothetical protein
MSSKMTYFQDLFQWLLSLSDVFWFRQRGSNLMHELIEIRKLHFESHTFIWKITGFFDRFLGRSLNKTNYIQKK